MLIKSSRGVAYVPGIPKKLHQIWLGPKAIPKADKAWMKGVPVLHPGWEYRLWTDADLACLWQADPFGLKEGFDRGLNYGFQSDILRLLILWLYGGVYLDTDCETLQPLDSLVAVSDAFIGATFPGQPHDSIKVENAILGFSPRHPFLAQVLRGIAEGAMFWPLSDKDVLDTVWLTGPGLMTKELMQWRAEAASMASDIALVPSRFLYAVQPTTPGHHAAAAQPQALLIHHFTGKWWSGNPGPKDFQPKDFQPKDFQPKDFQPKDFQPKDFQKNTYGNYSR